MTPRSTSSTTMNHSCATTTACRMTFPIRRCNALRALAMDAVEAAKSGHPGMPMGMAEIALALWTRHAARTIRRIRTGRTATVSCCPTGTARCCSTACCISPDTTCRWRSCERFRQLHSKTPGHPEHGLTPGVETTTGPARARVSPMRSAWRSRSACWRRGSIGRDIAIVDHRTYVFMGDGCLMEGISHEAASLAGTWGLGKLVAFYDDNGISIDGEVNRLVHRRHAGAASPRTAGTCSPRSTATTSPRWPRPLPRRRRTASDGAAAAPLLPDDHRQGRADQGRHRRRARRGARRAGSRGGARGARLDLPAVRDSRPQSMRRGTRARAAPALRAGDGRSASPPIAPRSPISRRSSAAAWRASCRRTGPRSRRRRSAPPTRRPPTLATRKASQQALEALAPALPEFIGGSADLTGSVFTDWSGSTMLTRTEAGNYIHFGVREFAHVRDRERARAARRVHSVRAGPSSCSPTTRETPCGWRR